MINYTIQDHHLEQHLIINPQKKAQMAEPLPSDVLKLKAKEWKCSEDSKEFARMLDDADPIRSFRNRFVFPKRSCLPAFTNHKDLNGIKLDECHSEDNDECIYFCGQSLGLKAKSVDGYVQKVLDDWGDRGVTTHFTGFLPAAYCDLPPAEAMAKLVGAKPSQIAIMSALTVNLHILLASFYRPTPKRYKIMIEDHAFPSDMYAVKSHLALHGYSTTTGIIKFQPRPGEHTLREEDIVAAIEAEGDSVAVILIPGVHYYTGQLLDSKPIIKAGHEKGCIVGIDLAHTVGNVEVKLDECGPDFAVWCTYKYLNSGAGGIGAIYVNEKHTTNTTNNELPILRGWWGNNSETRFEMKEDFEHSQGAAMFRISNPPPLLAATLMASLDIFNEVGMERLVKKQFLLTGYLEHLLHMHFLNNDKYKDIMEIITPSDPKRRGCQLSLLFKIDLLNLEESLQRRGVFCDVRTPDVIRVAPFPLYNSFMDVYKFIGILKEVLDSLLQNNQSNPNASHK